MSTKSSIKRAIAIAGSLTALAEKIDVSPQVIANWRLRNSIPAERVLDVERATGISRHELRPDIYPQEATA